MTPRAGCRGAKAGARSWKPPPLGAGNVRIPPLMHYAGEPLREEVHERQEAAPTPRVTKSVMIVV